MVKVSSPLINWILRALQALFGLVTLGLAATLIRSHHYGSLPSSLGFSAFVGGITILAALIGIAAVWLDFLDGIIGLAVDGLVAVLNIVGGIILAIKLGGVSCGLDLNNNKNNDNLQNNDIFNGGVTKVLNVRFSWVQEKYGDNPNKYFGVLAGHCKESRGAMVFMFMTVVLLVASALVGFLKRRKGY